MPKFCGHCHSDGAYMQKFRPDAPLDIVDKFWASAHGQDLKAQEAELRKAAAQAAPPTAAAPATKAPGDVATPAEPEAGATPPAEAPAETPKEAPKDMPTETPPAEGAVGSVPPEVPEGTEPVPESPEAAVPSAGTSSDATAPAEIPKTDVALSDAAESAPPPTAVPHPGKLPAASCIACHPKHQMLPSSDPRSALNSRHLAETCGACHADQLVALRRSVHAKAGDKNETGAGTLLDCNKCHGRDSHTLLPVKDPASPVFLDHQVKVCGECHERYLATYTQSVHGSGLFQSGLLVTAACADCHGAHDILYAADQRSTLHPSNVAASCGKCHQFLEERLAQSVHGDKSGAGHLADRLAPGGQLSRKPSCTDCHEGHDHLRPGSPEFRAELPSRCGNCHAGLADRYRLSLHGELTAFGYMPAAECADCHGAHDVRRVSDPASTLAPDHRLETCRKCHANAVANFAAFDPHASYKDAQGYPGLHHTYHWLERIIYVLVGLFALHMFFWFGRSFIHARRDGRDRPCVAESRAITSFVTVDRIIYVLLIVSFVGLAVTGLPLKYGSHHWAQRLVGVVGGFPTTSVWHRSFAVLLLVAAALHFGWLVGYMVRRRRQGVGWGALFAGPDSPVPNGRDVRDFLHMLRWFVGLGASRSSNAGHTGRRSTTGPCTRRWH